MIRPFGANVLMLPYVQKKTGNGIIIPETARETQVKKICRVISVGSETKYVKKGMLVIIPRQTGQWVDYNNEKYVLMGEDKVLAVIEEGDSE